MALDKLVDSTQLDSDLTSVANAIRAKSGGSSQLAFPAGFVSEIQAIPSGSSGISLLASGTYTKSDEASSSMSIPVSYSGNCALMLVYAEPISGVDQTNKWIGTPQPPQQIAENFSAATIKGMCEYTTSGGVTNSTYSSTCKIENGNIVVTSQNSSRKIQPNTYYWYLWG